jgi:hypothetical protein
MQGKHYWPVMAYLCSPAATRERSAQLYPCCQVSLRRLLLLPQTRVLQKELWLAEREITAQRHPPAALMLQLGIGNTIF